MAMTFTSESLEVPTDVDAGMTYVDVYESVWGGESEPTHQVRLKLTEDQTVELATLLLLSATKLRAERLPQE